MNISVVLKALPMKTMRTGGIFFLLLWICSFSEAQMPRKAIHVPFDELDAILNQDKQGVLLPRVEFEKLLEAASKQPTRPALDGALTKAIYRAETIEDAPAVKNNGVPPINGNEGLPNRGSSEQMFVLQAEIEYQQFVRGWNQIALPFTGLGILKATEGDRPATLGRDPANGNLIWLTEGEGKHTIKLEMAHRLVFAGSDQLAAFGLPPVPSARLKVLLPENKFLDWNEVAVQGTKIEGGKSEFELLIGGKPQVRLRITDRLARQNTDRLSFARTALHLKVAAGEVGWNASTQLQVFGQPVDKLTAQVPSDLQLVAVESPGLESWEFSVNPEDPKQTIVSLVYRQPFDGIREIKFSGILAMKLAEKFTVPTLKIAGITTHTAHVRIEPTGGLRVQVEDSLGISPEEQSAMETLDFRAWREDFLLSLSAQSRSRELHAGIVNHLALNASKLSLTSTINITPKFGALFNVELAIPAEWTILDLASPGGKLPWQVVPVEAGWHSLRIEFPVALAAGTEQMLILTAERIPDGWPVENEPIEIEIPEIRLLNANVVEGAFLVTAEPTLDVSVIRLAGLDPRPFDLGTAGLSLNFAYQDTRYSGSLSVKRKESRLSASSVAYYRLDRETLFAHLESKVDVVGGGIEKIQVTLPESAGTELRFRSGSPNVGIREQRPSAPMNGLITWTLVLDRRVVGVGSLNDFFRQLDLNGDRCLSISEVPAAQQGLVRNYLTTANKGEADLLMPEDTINGNWGLHLQVDLEIPRKDLTEFVPPVLSVVGAERETSSIVFEAGSEQQLQLTALSSTGQPLPELDVSELPDVVGYQPKERVVAGYRAASPGYRLILRETRFEKSAVASAYGKLLRIESVLGTTGEFQHRAELNFIAVGVQNLIIATSENQEIWSVALDGKPIELRRVPEGYLIPLISTGEVARDRKLEVIYRSHVGRLSTFGRIQQPPLEFVAVFGEGGTSPMEILVQEWKVHHPEETRFIQSHHNFLPDSELHVPSFFNNWLNRFQFTSPRLLAYRGLFLAGLALAVIIGRLLLARLTWRGVMITAAVLFCIIAFVFLVKVVSSIFLLGGGYKSELGSAHEKYKSAKTAAKSESAPTRSPAMLPPGTPDFDARDGLMEDSKPVEAKSEESINKDDLNATLDEAEGFERAEEAQRRSRELKGMELPSEKSAETVAPPSPEVRSSVQEEMDADAEQVMDEKPNDALPEREPIPEGKEIAIPKREPALGKKTMAGLLSLSVGLDIPDDSQTTVFHYRGQGMGEMRAMLDLDYLRIDSLGWTNLAIQAVIVAFCWFIRNYSLRLRFTLGLLGITIPIGLIPVSGNATLPIIESILFGSICGIIIWICYGFARLFSPKSIATILLLSCCCGELSFAQELGSKIIVPYQADGNPLAAEKIFLPLGEFQALWQKAHPESIPLDSPVDSALVEAGYNAELKTEKGKSVILVTARFVVGSFRKAPVLVPLPVDGISFRSVKLNGEEATLQANDLSSGVEVVLEQPGWHVIDAEFTVPATLEGPAGRFTLPLKPVPSGVLRWTFPDPNLSLRVNQASGAYQQLNEGEVRKALIPIDAGGAIQVQWQPAKAMAIADGITIATTTQAITVTDTGVDLVSSHVYSVNQGGLNEALLRFPQPFQLKTVSGPDVGGYEIQGTGADQSLRVFFRRTITDKSEIKLTAHLGRSDFEMESEFPLPDWGPSGVTRESGTVLLYASPHFALRIGKVGNLSQLQPSAELSTSVEIPDLPLYAFRYSARPIEFSWFVSRRKPKVNVSAEHIVQVLPRRIQISSDLMFELTGAPRRELSLQLPPGYLLLSLEGEDVADWHLTGRSDASDMNASALVHIDLKTNKVGTTSIRLTGRSFRQPEAMQALLNFPRMLQVDGLDSQVAVTVDSIYAASHAALDQWRSVDAQVVTSSMRTRPASAQFAFVSKSANPPTITMDLSKTQPRLSADAVSILMVRDDMLELAAFLPWKVTASSTDTLYLTGPDWLAGRLEFRPPPGTRIRQVLESKIGEGRNRWTIQLDEAQRGEFLLTCRAELPLPTDKLVSAPGFEFEAALEEGNFSPLEIQTHSVILINRSSGQLVAQSLDEVESLTADDLQQVLRFRQELINEATEIVRVKRSGRNVTWRIQESENEKSLPASVNLFDQTTVIDLDGTWRTELILKVRNRSRQFLGVKLPEESKMVSLFVNEVASRPMLPRGDRAFHLVPLPKTGAANVAFEVRIVYAGRFASGLPRGWLLFAQEIDVPTATIVSQKEDNDFGAPVSRTTWSVYLPKAIDGYVIDDLNRTTVEKVTSADQEFDRSLAMLIDVAELVRVSKLSKSETSAQAVDNLKMYQEKLFDAKNRDIGTKKSREYNEKALQINTAINDVITSNQAQGIISRNDTQGNLIIESTKNEIELFSELDKTITLNPGTFTPAPGESELQSDFGLGGRGEIREKLHQQTITLNQEESAKQQLYNENQQQAQTFNRGNSRRVVKEYDNQKLAGFRAKVNFEGGGGEEKGEMGPGADFPQAGGEPTLDTFRSKAALESGLSVRVEIPREGTVYYFSSASGGAKLGLSLRARSELKQLLGMVWTILWIGASALACWFIIRPGMGMVLFQYLPWLLTILGALSVLLFSSISPSVALLGTLAFLVGIFWFSQRYVNRSHPA